MLKSGEATEVEVRATKPYYCPNCGKNLEQTSSGTYPVGNADDPHEWSFPVYWDTYCKACDHGFLIQPLIDET